MTSALQIDMRKIEIDEDIYARLKGRAEPWEDTPSDVIRRLLEESVVAEQEEPPSRRTRVSSSAVLPLDAYEIPLLLALAEGGGAASASVVIDRVGELLGEQLTDVDRQRLKSGPIRWRNRAQFAKESLLKAGQIA